MSMPSEDSPDSPRRRRRRRRHRRHVFHSTTWSSDDDSDSDGSDSGVLRLGRRDRPGYEVDLERGDTELSYLPNSDGSSRSTPSTPSQASFGTNEKPWIDFSSPFKSWPRETMPIYRDQDPDLLMSDLVANRLQEPILPIAGEYLPRLLVCNEEWLFILPPW